MIGVTGATGHVGGLVAGLISDRGVEQCLLVRDRSRAPHLAGARVRVVSYDDGPAAKRAMTALDTVLMVSAPEDPQRVEKHRTFVDAAARAGVQHLVYISFVGAAPDATFTLARDHGATEAHISASGMTYTFLRDNLYSDFFPEMVGSDGVIRGPAAGGRVAAVAQRDIAEAAAAILQQPDAHRNRTYELTGPEALTLQQVAAVLSDMRGEQVTYQPETIEAAYESRRQYGAPDWQLDAWVSTYTAIATGDLERVSDAVEAITGHPATPLREVLRQRQ